MMTTEQMQQAQAMSQEQQYAFHLDMVCTFSSGSGRKALAALRSQCFMSPTPAPPKWSEGEQISTRYGRMTLFQWIEWWLDPANFQHLKPQTKEQDV